MSTITAMLSWRAWAGHDMLFHQAVFVIFLRPRVDPKSRSVILVVYGSGILIYSLVWRQNHPLICCCCCCNNWMDHVSYSWFEWKIIQNINWAEFHPQRIYPKQLQKGAPFSLRCHPYPCLVGNSRGDIKHDDGTLTCYAKDKPTKIFKGILATPRKATSPRNKGLVGVVLGGS